MALPVPRGGHAGSRADGNWKVHSKQAEHGRAVHCGATASRPVRGGQSEGGREGANAVVESERHRLGGGENKGRRGGDRQYQRIGIEHRRRGRTKGGREDASKASRSSGAEWSGASADEWE